MPTLWKILKHTIQATRPCPRIQSNRQKSLTRYRVTTSSVCSTTVTITKLKILTLWPRLSTKFTVSTVKLLAKRLIKWLSSILFRTSTPTMGQTVKFQPKLRYRNATYKRRQAKDLWGNFDFLFKINSLYLFLQNNLS